ncbi:MAG: hypothetical protein J6N55_06565 [Anaerovibrio sp.]|uniref:hypothetical protein n=1 Tax=Anaerovibrio sp. TaxID=1872532 RepID=UPI001B012F49|nr:hypothetical protein [Anaerovibrio sp.]MBO5588521.1 hypothetical protein [Anaerovibrio sp.]MBO6245926.1 hypothetical protein [Anaerovibrio sp.]
MSLDKIFAEMNCKDVKHEAGVKPMPDIMVGDIVMVELISIKNLGLVVAHDEGQAMIHFPVRPGKLCIPLDKVKDDIVSIHKFDRETKKISLVWIKGGRADFAALVLSSLEAAIYTKN